MLCPRSRKRRLPKTVSKLKSGKPLTILAWGDSVTTYNRWQTMFVERFGQVSGREHRACNRGLGRA